MDTTDNKMENLVLDLSLKLLTLPEVWSKASTTNGCAQMQIIHLLPIQGPSF
jgi:hypothetical protein